MYQVGNRYFWSGCISPSVQYCDLPWCRIRTCLQTSLDQFTGIYTSAIDSTESSHILSRRITNLMGSITKSVWSMTLCGLFERHKPVFTLLLAQKVAVVNGKVCTVPLERFSCNLLAISLMPYSPVTFVTSALCGWVQINPEELDFFMREHTEVDASAAAKPKVSLNASTSSLVCKNNCKLGKAADSSLSRRSGSLKAFGKVWWVYRMFGTSKVCLNLL